MGQLPMERVTPDSIFENVGVGPLYVKYGSVRKPTVLKSYVCVFVSLSVKAVHLELVSDLTTEAFIAALRRFMARRGHPSMIWSDNGTNFRGANRELREFLKNNAPKVKYPSFVLPNRSCGSSSLNVPLILADYGRQLLKALSFISKELQVMSSSQR